MFNVSALAECFVVASTSSRKLVPSAAGSQSAPCQQNVTRIIAQSNVFSGVELVVYQYTHVELLVVRANDSYHTGSFDTESG